MAQTSAQRAASLRNLEIARRVYLAQCRRGARGRRRARAPARRAAPRAPRAPTPRVERAPRAPRATWVAKGTGAYAVAPPFVLAVAPIGPHYERVHAVHPEARPTDWIAAAQNRHTGQKFLIGYARSERDAKAGALSWYRQHMGEGAHVREAGYEENPGGIGQALWVNALFAGGGAALGALTTKPAIPDGLLGGAETGLSIAAIGGLAWGLVSPASRETMFPIAGVGFIGYLAIALGSRLWTTIQGSGTATA